MNENHDTISTDQVLRVLRRRWWIVVQLVLAGAAVGLLLALVASERHEATATVMVESVLGGASDSDAQDDLTAETAARLVRTRGVGERVSEQLPDDRAPEELLDAVSTNPDDSGVFVDVTAHDDTAAGAVELANAFAGQFIAVRGESVANRVRDAIETAERQLAQLPRGSRERSRLASEIAELRATAALRGIDAQVVDPAVHAAEENDGAVVQWTAIGGGLGLLLGLVAVFSLAALDPRVRGLEELRRLIRAPQLAAMPTQRRRLRRRGLPPVLAGRREPFEHLRGALLVLDGERRLRRLVVTSPNDRAEGKTAVAANLAVSLARLGLRVCAVDTDLRQPALASHFGLDDAATGLADAIRGEPIQHAIQRFSLPADEGPNGSGPRQQELSVVAAGGSSSNAAELLAGDRMQEVLEELDREHDVVILDCAPVLAVGDPLPLLQSASGTILVVRHSHTPRRAVTRAAGVVDAQGQLLGIVATGVPKAELAAEGYGPWPSAPAVPGHGV